MCGLLTIHYCSILVPSSTTCCGCVHFVYCTAVDAVRCTFPYAHTSLSPPALSFSLLTLTYSNTLLYSLTLSSFAIILRLTVAFSPHEPTEPAPFKCSLVPLI
ncbi:hypothetical protein F5884DRAFT_773370 [Xylogone sp. PMI_703]|nr:hypothetical protein F5884DRAFT_773370 [Xylogone sp. PMI_703]